MNRNDRPSIPASVRAAVRNPPIGKGRTLSGVRRANTLPAHLDAKESLEGSGASQQNAKLITPLARGRSRIHEDAPAASHAREILVKVPAPVLSSDIKELSRIPSIHSRPSSLRPADSASQSHETTEGNNERPYAESVASSKADGTVKRRSQSQNDLGDGTDEGSGEYKRASRHLLAQYGIRAQETEAVEHDTRERLEAAGFTANQIEAMIEKEMGTTKKEKRKTGTHSPPVYSKIHSDHLDIDTLRYYEVPYEFDRRDPNYIIILREMDKYETEVLFEHTRRLRNRSGEIGPDRTGIKPQYAFHRKRDRQSRNGSRASREYYERLEHEIQQVREHPGQPERVKVIFGRPYCFKPRATPVDEAGYHLPIASWLRDTEGGKIRDRDAEEANRRFENHPDFNMPKRLDSSLRAITHSGYVSRGPRERHVLSLAERNVSPNEDRELFRRRHLQLQELDFDKFKSGVLELFEARSSVRSNILLHLEKARQDNAKRPAAGGGLQLTKPYSLKTSKEGFAAFSCCVEFFHLRQYGKLADSSSSVERPQTLLQTRYSGADRQQDLRQVIRQAEGSNRCLHISHLWAIIVNNDTLVTASVLSEPELFQVSAIKSEPALQDLTRLESTDRPHIPYIRVRGPNDAMWLLERAQYRTWFEFALHFEESEFALDEGTTVEYNGKIILPSQWPSILENTQSSILELRIDSSDDAPGSKKTGRRKDVAHRLQINKTWPASIGPAIAASFEPTAYDSVEQSKAEVSICAEKEEKHEQSHSHRKTSTNKIGTEVYLRGQQLHRELTLYRCCPSKSFWELLTAIARQKAGSVTTEDIEAANARERAVFAEVIASNSTPAVASTVSGQEQEGEQVSVTDELSELAEGSAHATEPSLNRDSGKDPPSEENTHAFAFAAHTSSGEGPENHPEEVLETDTDLDVGGPEGGSISPEMPHSPVIGVRADSPTRSVANSIEQEQLAFDRDTRFLAEGARAILYVFLEGYDQHQIDTCVGKLCGALGVFIARLDAEMDIAILIPGSPSHKPTRIRTRRFAQDLVGLMNIARVLQGDRFGVKTLSNDLGLLVPESFTVAMRSATLAIIFANSTENGDEEGDRISHWANEAEKSLYYTFYGTLQSLQKPPLRFSAAAQPKDVLGNFVHGITGRIMPDGRDVYEVYNLHIRKLEHDVRAETPNRRSVKELRNLRQELEAMYEQLDSQVKGLSMFVRSLLLDEDEIAGLDPSIDDDTKVVVPEIRDGSGTEHTSTTLANTAREAEQRRDEFSKLKLWTEVLLEEAEAQASDINDWRNNAVVIFTVVTIVFLPLSFVASVFGMNTADVRDMSNGQWLYWASALPFTALVVAATVYWSELLPVERVAAFAKRHMQASDSERVRLASSSGSSGVSSGSDEAFEVVDRESVRWSILYE